MSDSTTAAASAPQRLTEFARGGGCGCKLDPGVLDRILEKSAAASPFPDLIVDASTRDDAAVYRVSDEAAIVATTDFFAPVVDDPRDFGRIAATNALSDVYAMGARPIFCLAILGMPINQMEDGVIKAILDGGREVAEAAGAPVAGGHSIDSAEPFYGLVALGLVHPEKLKTNAGAKPGDRLILGKPLGVGVYSAALKRGCLDADGYAAMVETTTRTNAPGVDLATVEGVHAMTDVTGFGLLGHLSEVCRGAGLSARVTRGAAPVLPGVEALLAEGVRTGASGRNWAAVSAMVETPADWRQAEQDLLTDPQTSGGLLVACAPEAEAEVLDIFRAHGHGEAAVIGALDAGPARIRFD